MYKDFQKTWNDKWSKLTSNNIENTSFSLKIPQNIKDSNNKRLLDLWAWSWRDSINLAKKWFIVDAFDFSITWIENIKKFSLENWVTLNTIIWNTLTYEFEKNYYDIIYACNSLHYFDENDMREIVKKIKQALKIWWYIFIRVKSILDEGFGKWEQIWNNFYKNGDDIKYYFEKEFLWNLFSDFEILELYEIQDKHDKIGWWFSINWFIDLVAKKI